LNAIRFNKHYFFLRVLNIFNIAPLRNLIKRYRKKSFQVYGSIFQKIRFKHDARRFVTRFQDSILIIDHNLGGGANHYRKEVVEDFVNNNQKVILLSNYVIVDQHQNFCHQCYQITGYDQKGMSTLETESLKSLWPILYKVSLSKVIYNSLVHFRDVIDIVKEIGRLADEGVFLKILMHDFFPICPNYTLISCQGSCQLSDKRLCESCLMDVELKHIQYEVNFDQWRNEWGVLLSKANEIVCFSFSSKKILTSAYPQLSSDIIKIIPHSMDYFKVRKPSLLKNICPCVGIVGNISSISKGAEFVSLFAQHLLQYHPDIQVIIIGEYAGSQHSNIEVTGQYQPESLPDILEEHGVNIVFFPSIWPETFSYVVSELILLEVPLICFDLGAQAEKVRAYDKGLLIPDITPEVVAYSVNCLYQKIYA
jgi:glycosyltransferase involved in cell wall biosynthesis